jgi:hypothetical protein
MNATEPIVNKVAQSGLITLNPEDYTTEGPRRVFDLKDFLFMGLILKEKDYRQALKDHDWSPYAGAHVALTCSADAIVPAWAWMLAVTYLEPVAQTLVFGTLEELEAELLRRRLDAEDWSRYAGERVILKGCGTIGPRAYAELSRRLRPHVQTLMYGEPCSTVPVYKANRPATRA